MSATANRVDFRRLELPDLNAIEKIERDSYPTPWSRSMFAGELAKPSSISLGAFEPESGKLLGYLIISRYVDAWHVMNLAVAPRHRRKRIATSLLERLFEVTAGEGRRGYTLEVPPRRDLWDDPAVTSVQVGLRGDDVRPDQAVPSDHPGRGLVTRCL